RHRKKVNDKGRLFSRPFCFPDSGRHAPLRRSAANAEFETGPGLNPHLELGQVRLPSWQPAAQACHTFGRFFMPSLSRRHLFSAAAGAAAFAAMPRVVFAQTTPAAPAAAPAAT